MLDNNNQNIDKAFIKSSWKNMSEMLDQEMPVEKKEKNYTVLLLSGLLILSTLAIAYLTHLNLQKPKFVELTKEKITYKNIYVPVEIETIKEDKDQTYLNTPSVDRSFNQIFIDESTFNTGPDNFGSPSNLRPSLYISKVNTSDILAQAYEFIPSAHYLSGLDLGLKGLNNEAPAIDASLAEFPLVSKRSKRKIRYTLGASATASQNLDFTGYAYSAGVQFPLGRKTAMSIGLAHTELSRDVYFLPFLDKNDKASQLNFVRPVLRDEVAQSDLYTALSQMKQVFVPIKLDYVLNKKWSVFSGMNFRYTYNRQLRNPFNALLNRTQRSQKKGELEKRSSTPSYYNDENFGLVAGVNYNFNKFLSVRLDSEWGVNSILQESAFDIKDGNNYRFNFVNLSTQISF